MTIDSISSCPLLRSYLRKWNANAYNLPSDIDEPSGFFNDDLPSIINENIELGYETTPESWMPIPGNLHAFSSSQLPSHFIDGKMSVYLIGGGKDRDGFPRPILGGQIGVGWVSLDGGQQVRVSRVILLNATNLSSSDESILDEEFASVAHGGFAFIPFHPRANPEVDHHDFATVNVLMYRHARSEMLQWEKQLTATIANCIVCVDGRVRDHLDYTETQPVIGVVKSTQNIYLDARGLRVRDELNPCERTPAILLYHGGRGFEMPMLTFYMRLSDDASNPTTGIVRVEIREDIFRDYFHGDFSYLDALTAHLYRLRCVRPDYGRAAITTEPIYEVEQIIGASFLPSSLVALEAQSTLFA